MATKSGQSIEIEAWNVPLDGEPGFVRLVHQDWPALRFVVTFNAEAQVVGFAVERAKGAPAITARLLREVPYGALERVALGRVRWWTVEYAKGRSKLADDYDYGGLGSGVHRLAMAFVENQYPGRRGRSELEYAAMAARYAALVRAGSVSPVKDLHAELQEETGEYLSLARVRNIVYECRERLLLTRAPRGRGGGELTDKAKEILDGQHQAAP